MEVSLNWLNELVDLSDLSTNEGWGFIHTGGNSDSKVTGELPFDKRRNVRAGRDIKQIYIWDRVGKKGILSKCAI